MNFPSASHWIWKSVLGEKKESSFNDRVPPRSKAPFRVIIDHTDGLHEGVDSGGAGEVETGFFEGFAQGFGLRSF